LKVHHSIIPGEFKRPAVTIGIFDGVHTGHQLILNRIRDIAASLDGESVVVTLWPHPRKILQPGLENLRLLNTLEEKIELLDKAGIDHLLVIPFTKEFSMLTSCEFILQYLVEKIGIASLVLGFNHHFGRDREGDIDRLRQCAAEYHFTMEKLEPKLQNGTEVSSTLIRDFIEHGKPSEAGKLLGYNYSITGHITSGSQLGRAIHFPTANLIPLESFKLIPSDGVYVVSIKLGDTLHYGMANIGYRPTVSSDPGLKTIEVHIFDFNQDIYGKCITLAFLDKLRDEKKFRDVEALKEQLHKDRDQALHIINENFYKQ
jgi:riboflavin kinase / FMN adenylyltransferase